MQLNQADLLPVEDFKLRWHWTDPRYNVLPADTIARIRPIKAQNAKEVWQAVHGWVRDESLASEMFGPITKHSTDGDDTRDWLTATTGCTDEPLIVSWDHDTAVLVDCSVFCRYWDDFCYPGSDDVLVFPLTGGWALLYHHEEQFVFGRKIGNLDR